MAKIRREKEDFKIIKPSEFFKMTEAQQIQHFKDTGSALNWAFEEAEKRGGFQDDFEGKIPMFNTLGG